MELEEVSVLKNATNIVVHNHQMKKLMHEALGIPSEKMIELDIFDYLIGKEGEKYKNVVSGSRDIPVLLQEIWTSRNRLMYMSFLKILRLICMALIIQDKQEGTFAIMDLFHQQSYLMN